MKVVLARHHVPGLAVAVVDGEKTYAEVRSFSLNGVEAYFKLSTTLSASSTPVQTNMY